MIGETIVREDMLHKDEIEQEKLEIRDLLIGFWVSVIQDSEIESPTQLRASELLAKYILDLGKVSVRKKPQSGKPSTKEILDLVTVIERDHGK